MVRVRAIDSEETLFFDRDMNYVPERHEYIYLGNKVLKVGMIISNIYREVREEASGILDFDILLVCEEVDDHRAIMVRSYFEDQSEGHA